MSIDFSPRRILEYLSEAIRPIYAQSGPYVELRTSNLSSLGCILSYIIEYYALRWCILLLYVANIVYLRPMEMVEAQILAQYSRISSIYTRSSANTRECYVIILVRMRVLISLRGLILVFASIYLWSTLMLGNSCFLTNVFVQSNYLALQTYLDDWSQS